MNITNAAGSRQRRIMHGRVTLTPNYGVDVTLYDYGGVFSIEVVWDPCVPDVAEFRQLSPRVEQALAPFHLKAFELSGLISGDVV